MLRYSGRFLVPTLFHTKCVGYYVLGYNVPSVIMNQFLGPNATTDPSYVRSPARHLRSWLQSITCRQSARYFDAVGTGLSTATSFFPGKENYKISGHFQDIKPCFQAKILSHSVTKVLQKYSSCHKHII